MTINIQLSSYHQHLLTLLSSSSGQTELIPNLHKALPVIAFNVIIVAVLKAIMFYLIVKLFIDKKLCISQPFSTELRRFILNQTYLALGIGLFAHIGLNYGNWLTKQGAPIANFEALNIEDAVVWIFMGVVLFVIAQVVNQGIEFQNENDLTI